ncbi:MAG: triose-phosphate isomerase [Phycisphaerales bacterium]|nr:MAG: triose-phosphate isomerase [Phycisphaerales bacterium]
MAHERTPIVGGNWKMNTNRASAAEIAHAVREGVLQTLPRCDVVIFPPFPYLETVGAILADAPIRLGAQDVFPEPDGAFTGEVSCAMLEDLGVDYVLAGHSERRHVVGEDDELVNRKVRAVLAAGMHAVLCVGETLEQREAGRTEELNVAQLRAGLDGVARADLDRVVLAYEPVWAIGTGRTASPDDAAGVHKILRATIGTCYDAESAAAIRIQYGGSVKADNAGALFDDPEIDGGLIGGASLKSTEFLSIVRAAGRSVDRP